MEAVAKLLSSKPELSALSFYFCNYNDDGENILQLVEDCVMDQENNSYNVSYVVLTLLNRVNGNRLFKLMQDISNAGGQIKHFTGSNSDEKEQKVDHTVNEEEMPEKVEVGYWWTNHLGPWY